MQAAAFEDTLGAILVEAIQWCAKREGRTFLAERRGRLVCFSLRARVGERLFAYGHDCHVDEIEDETTSLAAWEWLHKATRHIEQAEAGA